VILAALPIICFGPSLLYFAATNPWPVAFIKAAVVWGLLVVANTELLSLLRALSHLWLSIAWAVECCLAGLGAWQRRVELAERLQLRSLNRLWHPVLGAVVPIVIIVAATGVTAWMAPPNTWDSMTYHSARVAHWVADATVALYPTNVIRQLYSPPWAEYAVLQFQVISGTDYFANLVQWFSMVGSVVAVPLIAWQLGAPPRGQFLAAIVVVTLPMGILQSSSTQTDYVTAFWLVCSASFAMSFVARSTPQGAAWLASSLGLAMLSKGTAYLFAAPLVLLMGFWLLSRLRKGLVFPALLMLFIPLVINSGYYFRNEALFHNPLGANPESAQLVNTTYAPQAVVSNVVRDAILQFGSPNPTVNNLLERAVTRLHSAVLHIGVSDPATTFPGASFHVNPLSFDEDYSGDPLQTLLAIAAVLAAIGFASRRGPPLVSIYALGLIFALLIFAVYLRWQPWHARLELPLLVLSAPLIGAVIAHLSKARVTGALSVVLLVAAVPWVIDNQTRPMVGFPLPVAINPEPRFLPSGATIFNTSRTDLYFVKRPNLESPYVDAMKLASRKGCGEIALWSGPDDWEYPLWVLVNRSAGQARIDQVLITNQSIDAQRFGVTPCLLVTLTSEQPPSVAVGGIQFTLSWIQGGVGLYEPTP
jgi:hypothetical protein